MLKDINVKTIKKGKNYISECEVENTETKEKYYVVSVQGDTLYATYKSSYMDYITGKKEEEPEMVEGRNYLWFDMFEDTLETIFYKFYMKTMNANARLSHKTHLKNKYSHIKPHGNIDFKIINKRTKGVFGCGPMGDVYEIEFLLQGDKHLYVYADNFVEEFMLYDYSAFDLLDDNDTYFEDPIEVVATLSEAKKSEYYDLYLEMEKFMDGYEK